MLLTTSELVGPYMKDSISMASLMSVFSLSKMEQLLLTTSEQEAIRAIRPQSLHETPTELAVLYFNMKRWTLVGDILVNYLVCLYRLITDRGSRFRQDLMVSQLRSKSRSEVICCFDQV